MTMVSDATKTKLSKLVEEFNETAERIGQMFKSVVELPVVKQQGDPEDTAVRIVRARLLNEFSSKTEKFYVFPFSRSGVKPYKKDGQAHTMQVVRGLVKKVDNGHVALAQIKGKDENAPKLDTVEGGVFELNLNIQTADGSNWLLWCDDSTKVKKSDVPFPEAANYHDYLLKSFPKKTIADLITNPNPQEVVLMEGQVMRNWVTDTKEKDRKVGFYSVTDDLMTKAMAEQLGGGLKVLVDPEDCKHGLGSILYFVGHIERNDQYGFTFMADMTAVKLDLGNLGDTDTGTPKTPKPTNPDAPAGPQFSFDS